MELQAVMKRVGISIALLLVLWCAPARAQFDAQATYVSATGGSGVAVTILVPNVSQLSDLTGVPLRVLMTQSLTGPATLQVNTLAATAINKPSTAGLIPIANGDVVLGQIATYTFDGTVFELGPPNLNLTTVQAASGFVAPINLQLNCSAAANALTCAVKAANTGADPTSLSPVYIPFADTTTTSGDPIWVTITSAVSFTFAGGNTAGCSSASPCRLWITLINNAGTVVLGLSNQSTATAGCSPLNEGVLQTTGTGTSGGNTAGTIYTSVSALSSKAVRIAGYVEWTTLTTAGNWTAPNFVRLFGPGIKKPCDPVQSLFSTNTTVNATTNASYTTFTNNQSLVPTSAVNLVRVLITGTIGATTGQTSFVQLSRTISGVTTAIGVPVEFNTATGTQIPATLYTLDAPATTLTTTYQLQGKTAAGTLSFPPASTGMVFQLDEIMGALEPANDNGSEQRMTG
jgi:hypothetical protein